MNDTYRALTIVDTATKGLAVAATIKKHWSILSDRQFNYFPGRPDRRDLVPLDDLQAMLPTLAELAKPAEHNTAVGHMAMLVGAYPHANVPDLEIYTKTLTRYAKEYPPAVLEEGVDLLLRTLKFPPSIQELTDALDKVALPIQTAAHRARRMIELHAECDKLEAEAAERQREFEADDKEFRAANGGKSRSELFREEALRRRGLLYEAPTPTPEPFNVDGLPDAAEPSGFTTVGGLAAALVGNDVEQTAQNLRASSEPEQPRDK